MTEPKKLSATRLKEMLNWFDCAFHWEDEDIKDLLGHIAYQAARISELEAGLSEALEYLEPLRKDESWKPGVLKSAHNKIVELLSPKDTQRAR